MNNARRTFIILTFSVVIVLGSVIARSVILGNTTTVVSLPVGPLLSGVVSQSMAAYGSNSSLPAVNKDYVVESASYFDDKKWVVVVVKQVKVQTDSATIILRLSDGTYQTVLGPGTAFPSTMTESFPDDLNRYLYTKGVIYVPTN